MSLKYFCDVPTRNRGSQRKITTDDLQSYVILSYQNYSCKLDFSTTRALKLSDIW